MATGNARGALGTLIGPATDARLFESATSGVRPATRVRADEEAVLVSALVEVRTGRFVDALPAEAGQLPIAELATALPELFGARGAAARSRIWGEIQQDQPELVDLVLISPQRVHVLQRLPNEAGTALVSVAHRGASIGWIVSEARSRLERA